MGMTINKAMEILTAENFNGYSISEIIEARNMTLDIMQKYQKIQTIAEKCNLKLLPKEAMNTFMKDVFEVLEDGKTD